MEKQILRNFYGQILGYIEEEANGDKLARDFYGKILGYYKKHLDITTDFYGRTIGRGDMLSGLVYSSGDKK